MQFRTISLAALSLVASALFAMPVAAQEEPPAVSCISVVNTPDGIVTSSAQIYPTPGDCEAQASDMEASAFGEEQTEAKQRCSCNPVKSGESNPSDLLNNVAFKPLGDTNLQGIIGRVIKFILGLTGVLGLVMFIYGGLLWMTAAGNSSQIDKAKSTLVWSVLGIIAVFSAYALVDLVIKAVS